MPFVPFKKKNAVSKNIGNEVKAGKPVKQAVAIVLSEKAKSKGPGLADAMKKGYK